MKALLTVIALIFVAHVAHAAPPIPRFEVKPLGNVLKDAALDGAAATRTFQVETRGYKILLLHVTYTYVNTGTLTFLPYSTEDAAGTEDFDMTTCSTSAGACTLNFVTGSTTPSLAADKKFAVRLDVSSYRYVEVRVTHNGAPAAGDIADVWAWLIP